MIVGLLSLDSALHAQATVSGRVVSDSTRQALPMADLIVEGLGRTVTTAEDGSFRLTNIPLGVYTLRIRRIGFRPAVATLRIEAADSISLEIPLIAWIPELEPILVVAPRISTRDQEIANRQRSGFGRLIPYDRLREREHLRLAEILRAEGLTIVEQGFSVAYAISPRVKRLSTSGVTACPMQVLLNGLPSPRNLNQIPVASLGAVEVFKSGLQTPVQYGSYQCGVILLWTRDR